MKTHILIALVVWMIVSLILTLSVIGLLVWVRSDDSTTYWKGDEGRSTWARIGQDLTDNLIKN
jgi:flagellar biosynthesis/type III secretory pathway M-ring protein FliF/YscJ